MLGNICIGESYFEHNSQNIYGTIWSVTLFTSVWSQSTHINVYNLKIVVKFLILCSAIEGLLSFSSEYLESERFGFFMGFRLVVPKETLSANFCVLGM